MKVPYVRLLALVAGLSISFAIAANDYPTIWVDCGASPDNNGMFLEYLGSDEYCYRIKVRCDEGLFGGFLVEINTDDGGVGLGGNLDDGAGAFCFMNFGHLGNLGFTHSCEFPIGKAELDVKAVHGENCLFQ